MNCFRCFGSPTREEEGRNGEVEGGEDSSEPPRVPPPSPADTIPSPARRFNFSELAAATENFSKSCLLGWGILGCVFKGHLDDGQVVVVKRLNQDSGNKEFQTQIHIISQLRHPNIVNLIGYCYGGNGPLLVYEFMPLGSLRDHLHDLQPDQEPLDWNTRMKIATGVAQGLDYLHSKIDPPIFYRYVKSTNILFAEGYHPKLSDIGLEGFFVEPVMRALSFSYEYPLTRKLIIESDVYSFGIVFLELITGRKAINHTTNQILVSWARPLLADETNFISMADPLLLGQFPARSLYEALQLAALCVHDQESLQPSIKCVAEKVSDIASQTYDRNTGPP